MVALNGREDRIDLEGRARRRVQDGYSPRTGEQAARRDLGKAVSLARTESFGISRSVGARRGFQLQVC
jgi:hypothetical protein